MSLRFFFWSIGRIFALIRRSLQALSQASLRVNGILLFLGGLTATGGCLAALLNPSPLAATWIPSIWAVILGVLVLVAGMLGMYTQNILRAGILGWAGVTTLLLGTLILVTGAVAVNMFILPWMTKLIDEIAAMNGQVQRTVDQAILGVNSATSNVGNTLMSGCKNALGPASQNCGLTPAPLIPHVTIPSTNGLSTVNRLLSELGLAPLDTLKIWGLSFLSGAPLALGCLLLGLTFLRAGLRPHIALIILMCCAFLNLGSLFVLHLLFLSSFSGVLFFLSIAWLGFTLWSPWKLDVHFSWQDMFLNTKISIQRIRGLFKGQTK